MNDISLHDKIESLLLKVQKPARYSGGELNSIIKPQENLKARFAFCFPDSYEVGMSHLGIKILYHAINRRDEYSCERVFAPWPDMEALMRENNIPLFTNETRSPVGSFDIVGFTLQYELSYTNILNMLNLAGIPLLSKERNDQMPIIIAGGPCACNPETLADFIDVFLLGDSEESVTQIMDMYCEWKNSGKPRADFLKACAKTPGMYVPMFYEASDDYGAVTPKAGDIPAIVRKTMIEDMDGAAFPETLIVPFTETVFDRVMLEIARGCTKGCRFCQAGYIYRPVREREVKTLIAQADRLIAATGYEEISLSSLSSGDYSCLSDLTKELVKRYRERHVSIALPSLRIDSVVKDALADIGSMKKSSLTFAPEAGTQRLRDVINKGVTEEDLLRSVSDAYEAGYTSIKLYFMLGLPTETLGDLDGIADLARKVREKYYELPKEMRPRAPKIGVSVSTFVPKPHTAFQWAAQDNLETIMEKQKHLRDKMRAIRGVDFTWHEPYTSFLEAAIARGDRRLCAVQLRAYELGCKFDGWSEHFKFDSWMQAFADCGLDPKEYAQREIDPAAPLPWDHISFGVTKEFLSSERAKSLNAQTTSDCRKGCLGCGIQDMCEGGCPTCAL